MAEKSTHSVGKESLLSYGDVMVTAPGAKENIPYRKQKVISKIWFKTRSERVKKMEKKQKHKMEFLYFSSATLLCPFISPPDTGRGHGFEVEREQQPQSCTRVPRPHTFHSSSLMPLKPRNP